jgi:predicted transcriptional regulator
MPEDLDSRVFETLVSHKGSGNRSFTGGGEIGVRASEIADVLGLGRDLVADSLERLETRGRVRRGEVR